MKILKLLPLFLVFPLAFYGQTSLTGLWTGTLSNDSNTIRKDQTFEIALTEYRGKVYGYSRMNFIVNDTLYYIVKRVKGNIENDVCEVKDDEIIKHNFPRHPDKGVKLISTFRRSQQDSIWRLDGDWKTTETKKHRYYSISGKISLKMEADLSKSKIFPHLEELNLADDVAFYRESKTMQQPMAASQQTATPVKKEKKNQTIQPVVAKKENTKPDPVISTIAEETKSNNNKSVSKALNNQETGVKTETGIPASEETVAATSLKKSNLPVTTLPEEQKKNVTGESPKPEIKKQDNLVKGSETFSTTVPVEESKTETKKTVVAALANSAEEKKIINNELQQPTIKFSGAAAFVAERKTVAPQLVEFKSDSLEIKLYDNGEIDGDTVSVLLNGEILLAKQGLKASAIKKTIYIQPGLDEVTLVLYAENLGKYPPNTGLLVVNDGEETYQLRFSADLQQNAAVVFRKKK